MPRKYTKKSEFWERRKKLDAPQPQVQQAQDKDFPTLPLEWDGNEHFSAIAACGGGSSTTYRDGGSQYAIPLDAYKNIDSGILPWEYNNGMIGINRAMILVQKAYANVAVVRNCIESMVEFSSTKLHVKSANATVKAFFEEWLTKTEMDSFMPQFFRCQNREGNTPIYKFMGQMTRDNYIKMKSAFGAKSDIIPIRYIILNPAQVYLQNGIGYKGNTWAKILSTFEIERLRFPKTEEDKQIFASLPPEVKDQIKNSSGYSTIFMPLDPERLSFVFYKKQAYEPFAVPMVFPILNDIEYKLELKKYDMSIARTVEQIILLITTGQKNDEHNKAGMNPQNLINLQNMFKNTALGRVLVADYTTKGEWLIPPIDKILGPEKYQQVESDIKEGLQSIMSGDDKFANASIKAKVFLERLKEGQKVFLNEFLMPEVRKICENMGFKTVPVIEFEQIDLNDTTNLDRLYIRLAELGILSPSEVMEAIQTGILPDKDANLAAQAEYTKQREKGYYFPLVGGSKEDDGSSDTGRPAATKAPQTTKKVSPIGTKGSANQDRYSAIKLGELSIKADALKDKVAKAMKKKFGIKAKASLDPAQATVIESLAKAIIANEAMEDWDEDTVEDYIKSPKEINEDIATEMNEIAMSYDTSDWQAAIITKARIE